MQERGPQMGRAMLEQARAGAEPGRNEERDMSGYLNKASLIGNLGADPEVRTTATGTVVTFNIATSEGWKDARSGERVEKTEWHRIVIWTC